MSPQILQINFQFNVPRSDYENAVAPLVDSIAEVSGLQWKIWLMNETDQEAGGILLFDRPASLQAYLDSPIAKGIAHHPALSEMSVKRFAVLEPFTTLTRGPVKQAATV